MKFKFVTAVLISVLSAGFVLADDCGNKKDHGNGTPACKNNGNGNNGGSGNGGNGGNGGDGGNANVSVSNQNLNINQSNSNSNSNSNSTSKATSTSKSAASSESVASQSQLALGGDASNAGNTQSTSFNQVRQTASAIAPDTFPTSPCFKTASGAGQGAGFGFSLSGGKIDAGCDARETARILASIGSRTAACKLLVNTKAAKKAGVSLQECLLKD